MFYIFVLVLSLTGQPHELLRSTNTWVTKDECDTHIEELVAEIKIKLNQHTKSYIIVGGICDTEANMKAKIEERKS